MSFRYVKYGVVGGLLLIVLFPLGIFGQELVQDQQEIVRARVVEVVTEEIRSVPGTSMEATVQTLRAEVLKGPRKGSIITFENDYTPLSTGDTFYLLHTSNSLEGRDYYSVYEPYRLPALYFFSLLFVLCVLFFGGMQGFRGLLSLVGSLLFIFFVLFPAILKGYSPVFVSVVVASLITILGSYVTHGFNRTTTSAVVGMVFTIILTGFLASVAVDAAQLSGFESEEAVYLNLDTQGTIDFVGLLLGGILIGLLGVLYDAAIGQAIAIEELYRAGPHLTRRFIFTRALRMGREHIGALVNTLAIAYVGASLPLLLLLYTSAMDVGVLLNREIFAAEIIRTMIGSIGLVLAVPFTSFISVIMLVRPGRIHHGTDDAIGRPSHTH